MAGKQEQQTSPNSFLFFPLLMPLCFEIPLSISVCPPLLLLLLIPMFCQVSIPIPLHCHHGNTWPVTSLCRSSVLVSFFNFFTLSFSLLCLADYEWIKQLCVNLQSSFDWFLICIYIKKLFLMFHSVFFFFFFCLFFGCPWFVLFLFCFFLQLISFWSSSFHSLHNIALADARK